MSQSPPISIFRVKNCSKIDNLPRTIELRTNTGKIVRPIQKLALPEYEIIDTPVSNYVSIDISKIAIPEISDKAELQKYINKEF